MHVYRLFSVNGAGHVIAGSANSVEDELGDQSQAASNCRLTGQRGSRRPSAFDHEDDPGDYERHTNDQHRDGERVPPRGVVDQTPIVGCTLLVAKSRVRTSSNSQDRHEEQHQDADDRQRRTEHPSPHAVTSWSVATWAAPGTRALPTAPLAS